MELRVFIAADASVHKVEGQRQCCANLHTSKLLPHTTTRRRCFGGVRLHAQNSALHFMKAAYACLADRTCTETDFVHAQQSHAPPPLKFDTRSGAHGRRTRHVSANAATMPCTFHSMC